MSETPAEQSQAVNEAPQDNKPHRGKKRKNKKDDNPKVKRAKIEEIPVEKRGVRPREAPKRKVALLIGYVGKNYLGFQRNKGCKTVEAELEAAIVKAGGISQDNAGTFNKVGWANCARTDKGVSAAGNVVSFKAIFLPDLVERINSQLPSDIRVWGKYRVGKKFNPKNKVSHRKYSYVLPAHVFNPSSRYQKPDTEAPLVDRVNSVLQMFIGSNNYHNFTAKAGPTSFADARATRIIVSFQCSKPFMIDDIQFYELTVVGQSFVLYQIRKMVGLVVCIVRDGASKNIVNACFQKPKKYIPTAPPDGLFLRECLFDEYNKHCKPHDPLTWADAKDKMDEFVQRSITPSLYNSCKADQVYEKWLANLDESPVNYERLAVTVETGPPVQIKDEEDDDGQGEEQEGNDEKDDEEKDDEKSSE